MRCAVVVVVVVSITASSVVLFDRLKHDDSRMRAPRGESQAQGGRFSPPLFYGDTHLHDRLHKTRVLCCASQCSGLEGTFVLYVTTKLQLQNIWLRYSILSIEIAMALSAMCPVVHLFTFLRLSHPRSLEVSPHPTYPPVPAFGMCRPRVSALPQLAAFLRGLQTHALARERVRPEHETMKRHYQ